MKTLGSERDEATGQKGLHNEELHGLEPFTKLRMCR
jgi:hypothetical protein